jgi:probable F420-dependent oxidoreductase
MPLLAAIAVETRHARFGSLVHANSYRNPELLACDVATMDHLSGGRAILGIGSGWFERDYEEYGYEFGTVGSRLDALARDLPVIEERWGKLNPAPTRRIPVLIGGGGEKKTLRIVAKHADIWHSFSDVPTLERKLGILAEHGAAVGRNVGEIEVSVEVGRRSTAQADEYRAVGASLFTIGITGPDYDLSRITEWIAWRDESNGSSSR